jgi:hypothetical protein
MKKNEPHTGIRNGKLFCFNCGTSYDLGATPQPVTIASAIMKQFEKDHKDCPKTWEEPIAEPDDLDSLQAIAKNAQWWLANGERGISSETMFSYLNRQELRIGKNESHPHDPSDFRRCYLLLKAVPQWRKPAYLNKMKPVSKEWSALIDNWDKLEVMLEEQMKTNKANGMYEFMQSLYK